MAHHNDLRTFFARGLAMARDPQNAGITDSSTSRKTSIYSPWYRNVCRVCRHTFREDDLVLPHPTLPGRMLHEDAHIGLSCWSRFQGCAVETDHLVKMPEQVRSRFLQGLHTHWHPEAHLQCPVVEKGSPLIRRQCPICRHTIRAGDSVVLCPCGRDCGGVFHQDITRHLTCWDTWSRSAQRTYCAFTGAPFLVPTEPRHE
jgi:hypothetical protein